MPPSNYTSCQLFQELEYAPANVRCAFENQQQHIASMRRPQNTQGGILQGLYWAAGIVHESHYVLGRAIIFIRSDATRWTLVHEFIHHLFHQDRIRSGSNVVTPRDVHQAEQKVAGDLQRLQHLPSISDDQFDSAIHSLHEFVYKKGQILLQNELEEVAIEFILLDLYRSGLLTATESNLTGSIAYVMASASQADDKLNELLEAIAAFGHLASTAGASSQRVSQIDALRNEVLNLKDELESVTQYVHHNLARWYHP